MRLIIMFISLLALEGCVGVTVIHDKADHITPPASGFQVGARGQFGGQWHIRTKGDLLLHWGEPDSVSTHGNIERWRYNKELSWFVLVPELIIPIPLGLPTGHSGTTFTFVDSNLASVDIDRTVFPTVGCGYYVLAIGCVAGDHDAWLSTFHMD